MMDEKLLGLHRLDARKLREIVPSESVSVTITSPPYWGLKDYGFDTQIGREHTYEEYLSTLQLLFADVFQVTKSGGSLWIVADTVKKDGRLIPLPFDLAARVESVGWRLQDVIIWDKTKTLPWSARGSLRRTFEYVLFFSKDSKYKYYINRIREPVELKQWWVRYPERYNPRGKDPSNIWRIPIPTQGKWGNGYLRHSCPFPPELVERIIELTTRKNDVVLDPFAGSGVVLAQAECMGRKPIGFELNDEYISRFHQKVQPEVRRLWEDRVKSKDALEKSRRKLTHKIQVLRRLKFPYLAIRAMATDLKLSSPLQLRINTVFAISKTEPTSAKKAYENKFLHIDLYFVVEQDASVDHMIEAYARVTKEAPLAYFGVGAQTRFVPRDTFLSIATEHVWSKGRLWLYKGSQFNKYLKPITLVGWVDESGGPDWSKYGSAGTPPIISNLRIRQHVSEIIRGQTTLDDASRATR